MDPSFSFPTPLGASLSLNHLTTLTNVFGVVPGRSTDDFLMIGLEEGGCGAFLQVKYIHGATSFSIIQPSRPRVTLK